MIVIQNQSTACTDADVDLWTKACSIQLTRDVAPAWGLPAVPLTYLPRSASIPKGAWPVIVLDNSDQQGALGYHSTLPDGRPYGRIFGETCRKYGVHPSTVLSHEASIEAFCDPTVNRMSALGWPIEPGDPVENDSYMIDISTAANSPHFMEDDEIMERRRHSVLVEVSDFALPSWYIKDSKGPWDHLGLATGPMVLRPGGYSVTPNGTVYAEEYPDWRKWTKLADASRTLRVIAAGAPQHEALRAELLTLDRVSG